MKVRALEEAHGDRKRLWEVNLGDITGMSGGDGASALYLHPGTVPQHMPTQLWSKFSQDVTSRALQYAESLVAEGDGAGVILDLSGDKVALIIPKPPIGMRDDTLFIRHKSETLVFSL